MKVVVLSSFTTSLFWFRIDMMKAFADAGCEVVAVGDAPETEWAEKFRELGIRYRQIPVQRNGTNPVADLKTLFALRKLLREEKPDRIFSYQAKTVIYGGIAARMCGIRHVYPLIAGTGSVFLGDGWKRKLVRAVLTTEYKVGLKKAPHVFFQNRDDLSTFLSHGILSEEKVVMINGSGVNLENFTASPLPTETAFLCISRLIRDKGVFEYLEAARIIHKQHPAVRCVLVGPFDTNPSAIRAEELQPFIDDGSVKYVGEQKDVRPFLRDCTAFVLPSYHEGIPKTALEAMAIGRPVITTDAPGCREVVTDGENGILVPVKNANAVADAMERIICDPALAAKMAAVSRKIAEEKYDVCLVNKTICETMEINDSAVKKEVVKV